jgi:hypothetical protein
MPFRMFQDFAGNVSSMLSAYAKKSDVPQPATDAPPGVADASATGTAPQYALANHTHASKARKARATTSASGAYTWTFDPPFTNGVVPIVVAVAETASGVTDLVNVQVTGTPTSTGCTLQVNRANRTVASLLGLTILSLPANPGATLIHAIALEP